MKIKNQAMLITYSDSLGKNLKDLKNVLEGPLKDVVGGIHILPFFPSSGDRGFAPMDYTKVDPAFGDWSDIEALSKDYYLMFDFMINHISRQSVFFQDFKRKKDQSEYAELFIRYKDFWPGGEPSPEEVDLIYKRKPRAPYTTVRFHDGTEEKIWCTFTDEQIDINVNTAVGKKFIRDSLRFLVEKGAATRTTKAQYPADFGNGRIAMFIGSSTAREFVTPAVAGKFPWGITVIPQVNPEKPVTVQYGANVAVFKTTPEKQRAAWSFVRWLAEPNQTAYWATHSTYMPLRRSVADRPEMKAYWEKDPQAQQCFEVAQYGVREPNVRGWQDVRKFMEEAFDKVVSGQKAPEAALAEAATKANAALKERQ